MKKMKREMEAYIVLLHLVSQGWATWLDIPDLLGWDGWKQGQADLILKHIHSKLAALSEEWSEDIPHINALMFDRFGNGSPGRSGKLFGCEVGQQPAPRPTPLQIAEYAKAIADYPNWEKVLKAFRDDAFR